MKIRSSKTMILALSLMAAGMGLAIGSGISLLRNDFNYTEVTPLGCFNLDRNDTVSEEATRWVDGEGCFAKVDGEWWLIEMSEDGRRVALLTRGDRTHVGLAGQHGGFR